MTTTARHRRPLTPDERRTFESLLEGVLPRAYSAALHLTRDPVEAEDVVQEAALLAFRGFDGFEPGSNFKAWFLKILTNAFLMRCRKNKRMAGTVSIEDTPDLYLYGRTAEAGMHKDDPDPARTFLSRLDAEKVSSAILALPLQYRSVATLYFVEDLSYAEIASMLGCPVGTVRSRLHRARALLQRELWGIAVDHGLVPAAAPEPSLAQPSF